MPPVGGIAATMGRRRILQRRPQLGHVNYVAILRTTLERYRQAIRLFFTFLHDFSLALPIEF